MKNITIIPLLLVCLMFSTNISAQKSSIKLADKYYEDLAYSKAIDIYGKIVKKDSTNVYVLQRIADSYYQMDEYDQAFKYYNILSRIDQSTPVCVYRYGYLLIGKGRYKEAEDWLKKYLVMVPDDRRAKIQLEKIDQIEKLKSNTAIYKVNLVDGNTRFIDMSPVYFKNNLVFSSSLDSFSVSMKNHEWNNQPFLDLYISNLDKTLINATKFPGPLNTRYHEGPICFSKDENTAYFTRNNFFEGKVQTTSKGVNNLKLFKATYDGKEWSQVCEFPYNSNEYSVGHAALSVDDKTIYFASNMPGSYGQTDIFKSTLVDGEWSKPVNLGQTINTEGKEMFPYVDNNGILYFASDGLSGLGGLDIYAAIDNGDGGYMAVNLGAPVNSEYDDFGYIINTTDMSGYFTSNRPGGVGNDDIYHFQVVGMNLVVTTYFENNGEKLPQTSVLLKSTDQKTIASQPTNSEATTQFMVSPGKTYQLVGEKTGYIGTSKDVVMKMSFPGQIINETLYLKQELMVLTVKVVDKTTKQPILNSNVELTLKDERRTLPCPDGTVQFEMAKNSDYQFYAMVKGYFGNSAQFSSVGLKPGKFEITIELDKIEVGKTFVLRDIYYDLDKWNIRPDAAIELDKVVKALIENPEVKVELSSHTDCRASNAYNDRLSQRRAESAVKYLVENGIASSRLIAKGYGENKLVNRCADGVKCTEAEHQMNRRTELKVLENKPASYNPVNKSTGATEIKSNLPKKQEQEMKIPKTNETAIIREQTKTNTEGSKPVSQPAKFTTETSGTEFKYYVVVGSFKSAENANKFEAQLKKDGYNPIRFMTKALYTVALGGYKNKTEAEAVKKKYLDVNPKASAWIKVN